MLEVFERVFVLCVHVEEFLCRMFLFLLLSEWDVAAAQLLSERCCSGRGFAMKTFENLRLARAQTRLRPGAQELAVRPVLLWLFSPSWLQLRPACWLRTPMRRLTTQVPNALLTA